jgi:DNA uptake protein ComE-like DNA-binding protein
MMDKQKHSSAGRLQERISIGLIGIILLFAFFKLSGVLQERMKDVNKGLAEGRVVNLNTADPANAMKAMLAKGYYFDDQADIEMIRSVIASKQQEDRFSNIGDLNKRKYYISAGKG